MKDILIQIPLETIKEYVEDDQIFHPAKPRIKLAPIAPSVQESYQEPNKVVELIKSYYLKREKTEGGDLNGIGE